MELMPSDKDWKLRLRYGRSKTQFQHYSMIADGVAGSLPDGFSCPHGNAFMAMKVWASSVDEACEMVRAIGGQIGFTVTGKIEVYETEPSQPPRENPYGYDIVFKPYDPSK